MGANVGLGLGAEVGNVVGASVWALVEISERKIITRKVIHFFRVDMFQWKE